MDKNKTYVFKVTGVRQLWKSIDAQLELVGLPSQYYFNNEVTVLNILFIRTQKETGEPDIALVYCAQYGFAWVWLSDLVLKQ